MTLATSLYGSNAGAGLSNEVVLYTGASGTLTSAVGSGFRVWGDKLLCRLTSAQLCMDEADKV